MFSPGSSVIFLLEVWDVEQISALLCPILSTLLMSAGSSSGLRGQTRPSAALHVPPGPSTSVESTATRSDAAQRWIWGEVGHRTTRAWHVTQTSAATRSTTLWRIHFILHLKISARPQQKHTRWTFLQRLLVPSLKHLFCFIRIEQPYSPPNTAAVVLLAPNLLDGSIWWPVRNRGLCVNSTINILKYDLCSCS